MTDKQKLLYRDFLIQEYEYKIKEDVAKIWQLNKALNRYRTICYGLGLIYGVTLAITLFLWVR